MSDERFREQELDRFWDEVVRSPGGPVAGEFDLDPAERQFIRRFQARGAVSPPDAVREHVRRGVLSSIDISPQQPSKETPVNQTAVLDITRPGPTNGRTAPRERPGWLPSLPTAKTSRRWLAAQFATAVLLVVTLLAVYLVFSDDNQPAVVPPGTATPEATPNADVPMYRGNPERTGVMPGPGPEGPPVELWRVQTGGPIGDDPAVVGGTVYVGSGDGTHYAVDAATGEERWRSAADAAIDSSPAVANGVDYFGDDTGTLHAVDAATGQERWRFTGSPLRFVAVGVAAGVVCAPAQSGLLFALEAASGQERPMPTARHAISRHPSRATASRSAWTGSASIRASWSIPSTSSSATPCRRSARPTAANRRRGARWAPAPCLAPPWRRRSPSAERRRAPLIRPRRAPAPTFRPSRVGRHHHGVRLRAAYKAAACCCSGLQTCVSAADLC
jgi:hypothetical protein